MNIRKIIVYKEIVRAEAGKQVDPEITRVAAAGIIPNPLAGQFEFDLSALFDAGAELGETLTSHALEILPRPVSPVSVVSRTNR